MKFRSINFDIEDTVNPRLLSIDNCDSIKIQTETNLKTNARKIAETVCVLKTMVNNNLVKLCYFSRYSVWIPYNVYEEIPGIDFLLAICS